MDMYDDINRQRQDTGVGDQRLNTGVGYQRLIKLEAFYKAVVQLTFAHDVLEDKDGDEHAVVFPNKLGKELEKVDPEWYKNA